MNTSRRFSEPLAETIVPDSTHDTSRRALAPAYDEVAIAAADDERAVPAVDDAGADDPADDGFVFAPRRILHAAIRIGKSFEFVVECCVL